MSTISKSANRLATTTKTTTNGGSSAFGTVSETEPGGPQPEFSGETVGKVDYLVIRVPLTKNPPVSSSGKVRLVGGAFGQSGVVYNGMPLKVSCNVMAPI